MTKKPAQRHFPYKHPTFGTKSRPKPKSAWENTVYYWWWMYLKRNPDYLACCENGGSGALAALYKDFGDIRGDDFKAWWSEDGRGTRLFAEPRAEDSIRVLGVGEVVLSQTETLTVSFPLNLPKKFLEQRFRAILAENHTGKRGKQLARNSKAKYRFQGQPNIPALSQALMVYDEIKRFEGSNPRKPYWEIANDLKIVTAENRVLKSDTPKIAAAKKNVLTAIMGRYKKRVENSIRNVGNGVFPSI